MWRRLNAEPIAGHFIVCCLASGDTATVKFAVVKRRLDVAQLGHFLVGFVHEAALLRPEFPCAHV
jgi:hypothetical protein